MIMCFLKGLHSGPLKIELMLREPKNRLTCSWLPRRWLQHKRTRTREVTCQENRKRRLKTIMKKKGIWSKPLIATIGMIDEDQMLAEGTMDEHEWKTSHHLMKHASIS